MMDRNLGATSATPGDVGALGLMYQWGRKDPFMGASSISSKELAASTGTWNITSGGSAAKTEMNPTTYYTHMYLSSGSWLPTKTAYDPCPAGWRVPEGGEYGVWAKALGTSNSDLVMSGDYTNWGMNFTGKYGDAETIWYPFSGYRDGSGALKKTYTTQGGRVSGYNYYWSCSAPVGTSIAYMLSFNDSFVSPSDDESRYSAGTVRCVKDVTGETGPAALGSNMESIDNSKTAQEW